MKANNLKEGRVYFSCGWSNPKYPVPVIRTYVYIGKNIEQERNDQSQNEYVFEDPLKYFEKEILEGLSPAEREEYAEQDEPRKIKVPEDSLDIIEDIDGLIKFLLMSKQQPRAHEVFE